MIHYNQGNLLEAPAEALVNTVNEVGVMGKGIALMFREAFPENTRAYEAACKAGKVHVGRMLVTQNQTLIGPRWIINFRAIRDLEQAPGHRLMEVNQSATELLLKGTVADGLPDWDHGRNQPVYFIDFEHPENKRLPGVLTVVDSTFGEMRYRPPQTNSAPGSFALERSGSESELNS